MGKDIRLSPCLVVFYFTNEANTRSASNPSSPPPRNESTKLTMPPIGSKPVVYSMLANTNATIKPFNTPTTADDTSLIVAATFFIVFLLFVLVCSQFDIMSLRIISSFVVEESTN